MRIDNPTGFTSNLTGSFTGSFFGDGSGLTGTDSGSWDGDFTGSAEITGSLRITGSISLSGSFKDQESSTGTAGQVLSSTVSGSQWVDVEDPDAVTGSGTTGTITKWTTGGEVIGDSVIVESIENSLFNVDINDSKLYVSSSGNVGIGTGDPSSLLSLGNAINAQKLLLYDDSNFFKYGFGIQSNELRQFFPNSATAKMTFGTISDSDGTTYSPKLTITSEGTLELKGNNSALTTTRQKILFDDSDTTVAANQLAGGLDFSSADASNFGVGVKSSIGTYYTGTGAYTEMRFATAGADGNNINRLTISSGGDATFSGNVSLADTKYIQLNNTSTDWRLRADNAGRFVIQTSGGGEFFKISSGGDATFKATTPSPVVSTPIVSIADSVNGVLGGIGALASGGYPLQIWGGTLEFKTGSSSNIATATTKLTIASGGNVGIGTDSPSSKLHLKDAGTNSDVGIKIGNDSRDWNLKVMGSVSDSLQFSTHDNSNVMTILPSGNLGIGTTSPQQILHINNTSGNFSAEAVLRGSTSTGTPKAEVAFKRATSGDGAGLVLRTSNSSGTLSDSLTIASGGEAFLSSTMGLTVGQSSTSGTRTRLIYDGVYSYDTTLFINAVSSHPISFKTNNTTRFTISSGGVVTQTMDSTTSLSHLWSQGVPILNQWYTVYTYAQYDSVCFFAMVSFENDSGDGANTSAMFATNSAPAYGAGFGVERISGSTNLEAQRSGNSFQVRQISSSMTTSTRLNVRFITIN